MPPRSRFHVHHGETLKLARALKPGEVFSWLVDNGFFPESYVLPPCFTVDQRPKGRRPFFKVNAKGKYYVTRSECVTVHFPRTNLTDRTFGIIEPQIHNDIAYNIAKHWKRILSVMFASRNRVVSYSFPVPIDAKHPGRVGILRSGRMIYEFLAMVDDDLAAEAYRYRYLLRADIKNFYPSIYTHSIAWALHGKGFVRRQSNLHNFDLVGNRLDRLFQCANDGCTNGLPIGPVVSDIAAELVAAAVDTRLSQSLKSVDCEIVRFKDDYRILAKTEADARVIVKHLQAALKAFNLELSDEKTSISELPQGLFREWASRYHAVQPKRPIRYTWQAFRELYLAVLQIDKTCPGTGVIDRFLADILTPTGGLRVEISPSNLQRILSMLLMLATLRVKAFPKVLAIVESVLKSRFGAKHKDEIVRHLEQHLHDLAADEERNKYLISWICYFIVSNGLKSRIARPPKLRDPITRSTWTSRSTVFRKVPGYRLFVGCWTVGKRQSLLEYLDVFNPPANA